MTPAFPQARISRRTRTMFGELDAGKPIQFDEGALETCDSVMRLRPTLCTSI
jgi:hypothetical protein